VKEKKKMQRLFDKEYETRSTFQIPDTEVEGEYTIYKDGTIETTCRQCKKQHIVGDKFAEKAHSKNEILEDALCMDCWKANRGLERDMAKEERDIKYSRTARVGQSSNLFFLTGGKLPKDFGTAKEIEKGVGEWFEAISTLQEKYAEDN